MNVKYNKVYNIDSRNISTIFNFEANIQTTITSPPYFDMKDYGVDNQIGYGQVYQDYLKDLKNIFSEILVRTREDGTLWIIIDTFKRHNNVVLLPFDLARELQEVGWHLQDIIIWKKDKTVPWSAKGFSQRKFEYILLFSKNTSFKYNVDSVRVFDTNQLKEWWVNYPERYNPKGKSIDELWEFPIPVQGSWGDRYIRHFCPLPKEMVARIISLSTDENDVVFDPFAGSGTVLSQAAYMKRRYLGIELNEKYIEMFKSYLSRTKKQEIANYETSKTRTDQSDFETTILNLRILKYAKLILNIIKKELADTSVKLLVEYRGKSDLTFKLVKVQYTIISDDDALVENIMTLIEKRASKPPFTKFGIEPIFTHMKSMMAIEVDGLYGYESNNTRQYVKNADFEDASIRIISPIKIDILNY